MKKMSSAEMVAIAALMGNLSYDVAKRMVIFIADTTTNNTLISGMLNGLVVDAKIKNEQKLAELVGDCVDETITKIKDLEVIICAQKIKVTYLYKRFAKAQDETKAYNTMKIQNEEYRYEVVVQNCCIIEVKECNFEDAVEFEVI